MKNFEVLSRVDLAVNLKSLVKREKDLTLEILDHLQEIFRRKLFLEMGYTSLFAFLTEEIGYCAGTAQLRIQTLRALNTVPQNRERVMNNEVSLNTLAKTQSFINNENKYLINQSAPLLSQEDKKELFDAAKGIPAHKVEVVLLEKKHEIDTRKAHEQGQPPPLPKPVIKKITLEVDEQLGDLIEEVKNLLSHTCPAGNLSEILKKALPMAIKEIQISKGLRKRSEDGKAASIKSDSKCKKEETFHADEKERIESAKQRSLSDLSLTIFSSSSMKSQDSKSIREEFGDKGRVVIKRKIPTAMKRIIWQRDQGRCQYTYPRTGKQCGSQYQLEYDHVRPWSEGGSHSDDNLHLCCRAHNQYRWQRLQQ